MSDKIETEEIDFEKDRGDFVQVSDSSHYSSIEAKNFKKEIGVDKKVDLRETAPNKLSMQDVDSLLTISGQKNTLTDEELSTINNSEDKTYRQEVIRNMGSYRSVLKEGKYTVVDYINATRFVTFITMNYSKRDSYTKVFPDRAVNLRLSYPDVTEKEYLQILSSRAASYSHGKLISSIMQLAILPSHLLYRDVYHEAMAHQLDIMHNSKSDMVAQKAGQFLIEHLSPPEEETETKNINSNYLSELIKLNNTYAQNTLKSIKEGKNTIEDINNIEYQEII